jgi:hypothetical protein
MLRSNLARRYFFLKGQASGLVPYSAPAFYTAGTVGGERHQAPRFNKSLRLLLALLYSYNSVL